MRSRWPGRSAPGPAGLPEDCRPAADAILLSAATAGMELRDLAGLAAEIYERSRPDLPDEDPAPGVRGPRRVRLETTFGRRQQLPGIGDLAGVRRGRGGLSLDALSAPAGAEDNRTRERRICARRAAGGDAAVARCRGLLPERAGTAGQGPVLSCRRVDLMPPEWQLRAAWIEWISVGPDAAGRGCVPPPPRVGSAYGGALAGPGTVPQADLHPRTPRLGPR